MKNKYNIPIILNDPNKRLGDFIDYYSIRDIFLKRRNISKVDRLIIFGIQVAIIKPGK